MAFLILSVSFLSFFIPQPFRYAPFLHCPQRKQCGRPFLEPLFAVRLSGLSYQLCILSPLFGDRQSIRNRKAFVGLPHLQSPALLYSTKKSVEKNRYAEAEAVL
jgi:hypothetical protein